MKKSYQKPTMRCQGVSVGEFCASTCTGTVGGKASWDEIVADINSAGYRTLAEKGDSTAPAMVS